MISDDLYSISVPLHRFKTHLLFIMHILVCFKPLIKNKFTINMDMQKNHQNFTWHEKSYQVLGCLDSNLQEVAFLR